MTAPAVAVCPGCDGDQVVVVEVRGTDVQVSCPQCQCPACGRTPIAPGLLCEVCEDEAEMEYDRRAERRSDV